MSEGGLETFRDFPATGPRPQHREIHVLLFPNSVGDFQCLMNKGCATGPTVKRPYPRRLESPTICRPNYEGNTFSSVI